MKQITYFLIFLVLLMNFGCKEKPLPPQETDDLYSNGVLVLNEGLFEQNNTSVTFFDGQTAFQNVFQVENDRGLGDTGNDFVAYTANGFSFVMILTNVSSQIEIVDRNSFKLVKQIALFDGATARQPRQVLISNQYAFVTNFDGTVVVVDLFQNEIIETIEVGDNPEGLVEVGDFIYVANSGGLNFPIYDSTVSVIDKGSFTVVDEIQTRINASAIFADSQDDIYLVSRGNYTDIDPALLKIDTETNTVVQIWERPFGAITQHDDVLYFHDSELEAIIQFDMSSDTFDPDPIISTADYATFYAIDISPDGSSIYTSDAEGYVNSSTIRVYTISGELKQEFKAALNASNFIFEQE